MDAAEDDVLNREIEIALFIYLLAIRRLLYINLGAINNVIENLQNKLQITPYWYYRYEEKVEQYFKHE